MERLRFVGCRAEGVVMVDIEVDRSRFRIGVGVAVAAGGLLAEPGRGGGCMGVCLALGPRADPERASVGV